MDDELREKYYMKRPCMKCQNEFETIKIDGFPLHHICPEHRSATGYHANGAIPENSNIFSHCFEEDGVKL